MKWLKQWSTAAVQLSSGMYSAAAMGAFLPPFVQSIRLLSWRCSWLQNDLEFLRIRSYKHEIMVAPSEWPCSALHACCCCKVLCNWLRTQLLTADPDFVLIVIQDPSVEA